MRLHSRILLIPALLFMACAPKSHVETPSKASINVLTSVEHAKSAKDFRAYWYTGLAEVNRYKIQQSRYGESHEGESVEIYVTEDFLPEKGVKYEFGDKTNAVPILKLHKHRRFYTGVYPYNIHTTVFLPTEPTSVPLKLAFSATEWCGISYGQFNKNQEGYHVRSHSYFQAEGDEEFSMEVALFEDAIWAMIRRDPSELPLGEQQIMPSTQHLRLKHKKIKPLRALGALRSAVTFKGWDSPVSAYSLEYPDDERSLTIYFEPLFPYRIVGFEERATAVFNPEGGAPETLTTRGILTHSLMLDYWSKHKLADSVYREALGLEF